MQSGGAIQLALEAAIRGVRGVVKGGANGAAGAGEPQLLAGSHHLQTIAVKDDGGWKYLYAGPVHRSLWRTIEWRLVKPMVAGMAHPLADLGCGDGEFGKALFEKVELGIDGEAHTIGYCDPKVYAKTALADVRQEIPAAPGSLGTIFSNSTLEHIEGVDDVLRNAARSLRPGGRLVFTVPSSGLVRAFTNGFGREYSDRLNGILGHHNLWTAAEWTKRMNAAGFSGVTTRAYMTDETAQWFASLHLPPWAQLQRRAGDWMWRSRMPRFRALVEASLSERDEEKTACLLVEGRV
jgi:SAM-dependent methyltransferase